MEKKLTGTTDLRRESGVQHVYYVRERGVDDLVAVRKAVEPLALQIQEHAVVRLQCVRVGMRVASSSLQQSNIPFSTGAISMSKTRYWSIFDRQRCRQF